MTSRDTLDDTQERSLSVLVLDGRGTGAGRADYDLLVESRGHHSSCK